jgi:hypothetical protein
MGHHFLLQCRSVQSLCSQSNVSTKATCISRTEDIETLAGWSPIVSELQIETEAGNVEVSKQQRTIRRDEKGKGRKQKEKKQ